VLVLSNPGAKRDATVQIENRVTDVSLDSSSLTTLVWS